MASRSVTGLLATLIAGAIAVVTQAAVYEPFVKVEKDTPGYSAIGLITDDKETFAGTAFLISPCHILTNYHVLYGGGPPDQTTFSFHIGKPPAGRDDDFNEKTSAKPVALGSFSKSADVCEDFAVLELNKCVGNQYGYVQLAPFSLAQIKTLQDSHVAIKSAGFPYTEGLGQISVSPNCRVPGMHILASNALAHTCNSIEQESGGPIFSSVQSQQNLYVFGMMEGANVAAEGSINDTTLLSGKQATDPALFNRAVPISCIYDRVKSFLPPK
jgi:V8-like Glu-specific endopeptidase